MRLSFTIALCAAFLVMPDGPSSAAGNEIFLAKKCGDCHYTEGPAREKTIADQVAKKGPELWYAGSKFQKEWLVAWLADPKPIRPLAFNSLTDENPGDHPNLSADGAAAVGEFLMGLTSDVVEAGVVKPKKNPKGKLIFIKKMPCSGCHQFPTRKGFTGGRSGPSLIGAGDRLNPDWILAYLQKPEVFKPVKMMPVFVGLLSDKDMMNVARFVASFKAKK
ncbi:MAG: cytochrome c [Hyphomicrobiales bacterium]|nr:cytochrome c [Hyphomicrobiales bacterium]